MRERIKEVIDQIIKREKGLEEKSGDLLALVGKKRGEKLTMADAGIIGRKIAKMPSAQRKRYLAMVRALGGWYGGKGKGRATLDRLRKAILNAYNSAKKSESLEEAVGGKSTPNGRLSRFDTKVLSLLVSKYGLSRPLAKRLIELYYEEWKGTLEDAYDTPEDAAADLADLRNWNIGVLVPWESREKKDRERSLREARRSPQPGVTKDVIELARKWLSTKRALEELQKQVKAIQSEHSALTAQLEEILSNLQDMRMRVDNVVLILEEVTRPGYQGPPRYTKVIEDLVKWCDNVSEELGQQVREEIDRLKKIHSKEVPPTTKRRIRVEGRLSFTRLFEEADFFAKIKEAVKSLLGWTTKMKKEVTRLERRAQFLKLRLQRV